MVFTIIDITHKTTDEDVLLRLFFFEMDFLTIQDIHLYLLLFLAFHYYINS